MVPSVAQDRGLEPPSYSGGVSFLHLFSPECPLDGAPIFQFGAWGRGASSDPGTRVVLLHMQSKPRVPKATGASGSQMWSLPRSTKSFQA